MICWKITINAGTAVQYQALDFGTSLTSGTSVPDAGRSRQLVDSNVAVYLPISTTAYVMSASEIIVNNTVSDIVYFNGGIPRTTGTVSVNTAQSYFYATRIA